MIWSKVSSRSLGLFFNKMICCKIAELGPYEKGEVLMQKKKTNNIQSMDFISLEEIKDSFEDLLRLFAFFKVIEFRQN